MTDDTDYLPRIWQAFSGDGKGHVKLQDHEDIDNYYLVRYPDRESPVVEIYMPPEMGELKDDQRVIVGYKINPHILQIIEIIP